MFAANRYDFKYIILLMFLLMVPSLLFAAPIETVTNTSDAGAGSLRQAIADVDPGGEIIFAIPGGGPNTIVISAPLVVDKPMTITGPGETLLTVMSGGGINQVLVISNTNPTQSQVLISDLTIHGGMSTLSAILNRENLTLNSITAIGSQDGITNSGELAVGAIITINNSNLTGNSQSGIFVFGGLEPFASGGHVTINDSEISDNDSFGIFNFTPQHEFAQGSTVIVNNTTIAGNEFGILNNGGEGVRGTIGSITEVYNSTITKSFGIMGLENGNGLFNSGGNADGATGGKVIVRNSTISDNDGVGITVGPGLVPSATASITQISNTTVSGNVSALVYLPGGSDIPVVEVKNSIFANGTNMFPLNCTPDTATLTSLGVNISTDDTCAGFVEVTPDELDLGFLQNNGGPTETQALSQRSSAVDVVTDCTFINGAPVLADQRGFLRPPKNCDAGAFELGATRTGPQIVPTLSGWGTIITTIFFGLIVVFYLRKRKMV